MDLLKALMAKSIGISWIMIWTSTVSIGYRQHILWTVFYHQPKQDPQAIFISDDIQKQVSVIKQQDGKDIWLYGGASLIKTFIKANLVNIYQISVHPIVLGSGKPLFENLSTDKS